MERTRPLMPHLQRPCLSRHGAHGPHLLPMCPAASLDRVCAFVSRFVNRWGCLSHHDRIQF
ncbi:MAG: hypothetical protein FRX49_01965 [Trebouxia sp. A1-2]|nr:MAG: hypothetical protein FRX49_01965 [Trebouxia sp. A1-2]